MITYRLWDSDSGYFDVAVTGWLGDAIRESGMLRPHRAQFLSNDQWIDVIPSALDRVCREVTA
jgi:hypothetical protein